MKETTNYHLRKPDPEDFYNIEDFNHNADLLDAALKAMDNGKLDKSGGTMTGPLVLKGDPTEALEAANKKYVDDYFLTTSKSITIEENETIQDKINAIPKNLNGHEVSFQIKGNHAGEEVEIKNFFGGVVKLFCVESGTFSKLTVESCTYVSLNYLNLATDKYATLSISNSIAYISSPTLQNTGDGKCLNITNNSIAYCAGANITASNSTNSAGVYAYSNSSVFLFVGKINSGRKGLFAGEGAIIRHNQLTNNASTQTQEYNGGQILAV